MMDFLSDVFEFDVDSINDSIHRGPLNLKLCEMGSTNCDHYNQGIIFSFNVKNEDELKEIMSKYNFFLYRKSSSTNLIENLELEQFGNKKTLTISDIDQRIWRFEFNERVDI